MLKKATIALTGAALGVAAARAFIQRRNTCSLDNKVVLVTGGTRGLGYLLAEAFAAEGARLAICARDEHELERARGQLAHKGVDVFATACDVADREQVEALVEEATNHYGRIDIVVNNAGIIQVGPVESLRIEDFEQALGVMYWGVLHTTLAVLPQMKARGDGQIVNITSIGGKVSIPHLLPYNSAKFAAVGLSEGLGAELRKDGIYVTTIVPGLMRTGSYLNALFKGHKAGEFTWFSLGSSLPVISMDARRAARQIVSATKRREPIRVLSIPAQLLALFHALFPGVTTDILELVNRFVFPGPDKTQREPVLGRHAAEEIDEPQRQVLDFLTTLGRRAAYRNNQIPAARRLQEAQVQEAPASANDGRRRAP